MSLNYTTNWWYSTWSLSHIWSWNYINSWKCTWQETGKWGKWFTKQVSWNKPTGIFQNWNPTKTSCTDCLWYDLLWNTLKEKENFTCERLRALHAFDHVCLLDSSIGFHVCLWLWLAVVVSPCIQIFSLLQIQRQSVTAFLESSHLAEHPPTSNLGSTLVDEWKFLPARYYNYLSSTTDIYISAPTFKGELQLFTIFYTLTHYTHYQILAITFGA